MSSFKIVAVLLLIGLSRIDCSVLAPAPVIAPAVRYTQIAPQNIAPFAAQVSTFTKGLNIYDAPYAAGVISGPILPRDVYPAPFAPAVAPLAPAPLAAAVGPFAPALAPAPAALAASPYLSAVSPFGPALAPGPFAAAPLAAAPAPFLSAGVGPAPFIPAGVAPAPLLPAPFARSVHAVAPGIAPALEPAPLLG